MTRVYVGTTTESETKRFVTAALHGDYLLATLHQQLLQKLGEACSLHPVADVDGFISLLVSICDGDTGDQRENNKVVAISKPNGGLESLIWFRPVDCNGGGKFDDSFFSLAAESLWA